MPKERLMGKIMIKNNKGFTLIELLAVIVIMGILMIVAIPAVTKYINSSKKDTFADSAAAYINAARYSLLNDEYSNCVLPSSSNYKIVIPLNQIDIDKGNGKSPFNVSYDIANSFVVAEYGRDPNKKSVVKFFIYLADTNGNQTYSDKGPDYYGTQKGLVKENSLSRNTISVKKKQPANKPVTKDGEFTVETCVKQ